MRILNWNPNAQDQVFEDIAVERIVKAAKVVRSAAKRKLRSEIGKGETTGINRPVYRTGAYAGAAWTARHFGELEKSIRVVQKKTKSGKALSKKKSVRIYAGHYLAYYADIFEFYRPYMRPALEESIPMIKTLTGAK